MSIKQTRDARFPLAWEHLQKWGEVLRTDHFSREGAMQKVQLVGGCMIPDGFERDDWSRGAGGINEIQRCAEQAR